MPQPRTAAIFQSAVSAIRLTFVFTNLSTGPMRLASAQPTHEMPLTGKIALQVARRRVELVFETCDSSSEVSAVRST
eukprot:1520351-Prymnesium_polylepis.1